MWPNWVLSLLLIGCINKNLTKCSALSNVHEENFSGFIGAEKIGLCVKLKYCEDIQFDCFQHLFILQRTLTIMSLVHGHIEFLLNLVYVKNLLIRHLSCPLLFHFFLQTVWMQGNCLVTTYGMRTTTVKSLGILRP